MPYTPEPPLDEPDMCPIHMCPVYPTRTIKCPECDMEWEIEEGDDQCSDPVDWEPWEDAR